MLTEKDYKKIKQELDECSRPLFFFDDDPDGLCSFLLFYRYKKEGQGICVKSVPKLDAKFARKVEEYKPDKVFILDVAVVLEEFVEKIDVPIVWVDHHQPLDLPKVHYFNPRVNNGAHHPTSSICYHVVKQDIWLATIGTVGDWFTPDFLDEFNGQYPTFKIGKMDPGKALFSTAIGRLARVFSYLLKGDIKDVMTSIKVLTRISGPQEILDAETPQAEFLKKRYEKIEEKYEELLKEAKKNATKDAFLIFLYPSDQWSFTSELSNELLFHYPKKYIIIGREKDGEIRMSLRSAKKPILPALEKALLGVEGYGGGHEMACGACVKRTDFERFVENLRRELL